MAKPDGYTRDSQGRFAKKGGAAVAAAALGSAVALGLGGGLGGGTAGTTADTVAGQSLRAKSTNSKNEARQGRHQQAWGRMGWKELRRKTEQALECAVNSYGQVQQFFLRTPCRALDRMILAIADDKGNTFVVSIAWVRMANVDAAQRLKKLADTDGTGNVTPIAASLLELRDVRFSGKYYDSDRRGALTVISEAGGHADGETMDVATEVAVHFPPP